MPLFQQAVLTKYLAHQDKVRMAAAYEAFKLHFHNAGQQERIRALQAQIDRTDKEIARAWGTPGTVGRSLRILGAIERDRGLDHLEEACDLLETAPARLERAKALAALGVALRHARIAVFPDGVGIEYPARWSGANNDRRLAVRG